jgi:DNA-binding NarL/FixJ family response regulator
MESDSRLGRIRILVADPHSLFRQAIHAALDREPDLTVVAEAGHAESAIAAAREHAPDVVVLDADLPGRDVGRMTDELSTVRARRGGRSRVIVVAGEEDQQLLVTVLEAGAAAYMTKLSPLEYLVSTTRAVVRGETVVPPAMLGPLVRQLLAREREQLETFERVVRLTRRELEVLRLVGAGANNQRIARELSISPQTARTHVQNVLGKLGVHSRLEAAAFVHRSRPLASLGAGR